MDHTTEQAPKPSASISNSSSSLTKPSSPLNKSPSSSTKPPPSLLTKVSKYGPHPPRFRKSLMSREFPRRGGRTKGFTKDGPDKACQARMEPGDAYSMRVEQVRVEQGIGLVESSLQGPCVVTDFHNIVATKSDNLNVNDNDNDKEEKEKEGNVYSFSNTIEQSSKSNKVFKCKPKPGDDNGKYEEGRKKIEEGKEKTERKEGEGQEIPTFLLNLEDSVKRFKCDLETDTNDCGYQQDYDYQKGFEYQKEGMGSKSGFGGQEMHNSLQLSGKDKDEFNEEVKNKDVKGNDSNNDDRVNDKNKNNETHFCSPQDPNLIIPKTPIPTLKPISFSNPSPTPSSKSTPIPSSILTSSVVQPSPKQQKLNHAESPDIFWVQSLLDAATELSHTQSRAHASSFTNPFLPSQYLPSTQKLPSTHNVSKPLNAQTFKIRFFNNDSPNIRKMNQCRSRSVLLRPAFVPTAERLRFEKEASCWDICKRKPHHSVNQKKDSPTNECDSELEYDAEVEDILGIDPRHKRSLFRPIEVYNPNLRMDNVMAFKEEMEIKLMNQLWENGRGFEKKGNMKEEDKTETNEKTGNEKLVEKERVRIEKKEPSLVSQSVFEDSTICKTASYVAMLNSTMASKFVRSTHFKDDGDSSLPSFLKPQDLDLRQSADAWFDDVLRGDFGKLGLDVLEEQPEKRTIQQQIDDYQLTIKSHIKFHPTKVLMLSTSHLVSGGKASTKISTQPGTKPSILSNTKLRNQSSTRPGTKPSASAANSLTISNLRPSLLDYGSLFQRVLVAPSVFNLFVKCRVDIFGHVMWSCAQKLEEFDYTSQQLLMKTKRSLFMGRGMKNKSLENKVGEIVSKNQSDDDNDEDTQPQYLVCETGAAHYFKYACKCLEFYVNHEYKLSYLMVPPFAGEKDAQVQRDIADILKFPTVSQLYLDSAYNEVGARVPYRYPDWCIMNSILYCPETSQEDVLRRHKKLVERRKMREKKEKGSNKKKLDEYAEVEEELSQFDFMKQAGTFDGSTFFDFSGNNVRDTVQEEVQNLNGKVYSNGTYNTVGVFPTFSFNGSKSQKSSVISENKSNKKSEKKVKSQKTKFYIDLDEYESTSIDVTPRGFVHFLRQPNDGHESSVPMKSLVYPYDQVMGCYRQKQITRNMKMILCLKSNVYSNTRVGYTCVPYLKTQLDIIKERQGNKTMKEKEEKQGINVHSTFHCEDDDVCTCGCGFGEKISVYPNARQTFIVSDSIRTFIQQATNGGSEETSRMGRLERAYQIEDRRLEKEKLMEKLGMDMDAKYCLVDELTQRCFNDEKDHELFLEKELKKKGTKMKSL